MGDGTTAHRVSGDTKRPFRCSWSFFATPPCGAQLSISLLCAMLRKLYRNDYIMLQRKRAGKCACRQRLQLLSRNDVFLCGRAAAAQDERKRASVRAL